MFAMGFLHQRNTTMASVLACLGGLCQAGSMGLPGHAGASGALQWVAMFILAYLVLTSGSSRHSARLAWIFQSTALAGTFWWIFISLHTYGGMNSVLAAFAVVALAAALALYWSISAAFFYTWGAKVWSGPEKRPREQMAQRTWINWLDGKDWGKRLMMSLVFGAAWMLSELCRAQWFTGFPWGSSGYAHNDTWLGIFAPWVGVYGIGALSAAMAMWAAHVVWSRAREIDRAAFPVKPPLLNQLGFYGVALIPLWTLLVWPLLVTNMGPPTPTGQDPVSKPLLVELLQGNVPQQSKFREDRLSAAQWYYDQIMTTQAELVITPETAFAMTTQDLPVTFNDSIKKQFLVEHQAVLLGIPSKDGIDFANSAIGLVGGRQEQYRYDKAHLVPFGEFIPPFFRWFTDQMQMPLGFFNRGAQKQDSLNFLGQRIAPNICYEDLFGEEIALQFLEADQSPSILVNMSNIAWFGNTVILDQHLEISRMRTLEFRRPMVRATNSGATAVIDHTARVLALAKPFEREKLTSWVQGRFDEPTFYAWWASRYGLTPLWYLGLGVFFVSGCAGLWRQRWGR